MRGEHYRPRTASVRRGGGHSVGQAAQRVYRRSSPANAARQVYHVAHERSYGLTGAAANRPGHQIHVGRGGNRAARAAQQTSRAATRRAARQRPTRDIASFWNYNNPIAGFLTGNKFGPTAGAAIRAGNMTAGVGASAVHQANAWWNLVGRRFGGRQPWTVVLPPIDSFAPSSAKGRNLTILNPRVAWSGTSVSPKGRANLARILFHEWTHNRQNIKPVPDWFTKVEGGAEISAEHIAKSIGLKGYAPNPPAYAKAVKAFNRLPRSVQARYLPQGVK